MISPRTVADSLTRSASSDCAASGPIVSNTPAATKTNNERFVVLITLRRITFLDGRALRCCTDWGVWGGGANVASMGTRWLPIPYNSRGDARGTCPRDSRWRVSDHRPDWLGRYGRG